MPAALRESAAIYERYTVELARASEALLRKFGRSIAEQQRALKRIADIAIDLFVGLCVTSRAAGLAEGPAEEGAQALGVAQVFARQAKRRMAGNLRRLERNEDEELNQLAGFIMDKGHYPWDVL